MERDVVISGDKVFLEEFLRWAFKKWCPAALSGTTQESPGKHSGSPDLVATLLPKDVVGAAQEETPGALGSGQWRTWKLHRGPILYELLSGLGHESARPWVPSDLLP